MADLLIGLMTPVIKGYGTDKGYDIANNMQQVYGGHGYVREWGMEQFVRDSRIAMIYEGTNGVQAMDLCGRKLAAGGGKAIQLFFAMIDEEIAAAKQDETLKPIAERLEKAPDRLVTAEGDRSREEQLDAMLLLRDQPVCEGLLPLER